MRIIKFLKNSDNNIISFSDEIDQFYPQFSVDYKNYRKVTSLLQTERENKYLYLNIFKEIKNTCCLNEESYLLVKSNIKSYLSNTQPFLRLLGATLDNKNMFDEITNEIYDNSISYRFCYDLRNIEQHGFFNIELSFDIVGKIQVFIYKNNLLKDFNLTAKTKSLFSKYPERIDLGNELNNYYIAQHKIVSKIFSHVYNAESHNRLISFVNDYGSNGILSIGEFNKLINEQKLEQITIKMGQLEIDKIKHNMIAFQKEPNS